MEDARQILEKAAEQRVFCEVLPRGGGWSRGQLVRVERGGVVVMAPGLRLASGEDVRCWFMMEGIPHTFEASVIRPGVAVPDRSHDGYLLGFLDGWTRGDARGDPQHGLDLQIVPPNGPGISLLHGPGHLVEFTIDSLTFTLPADHTVVFVSGGRTRLRYTFPGEEPREFGGRIATLVPGETHLLYSLQIEAVGDTEGHRRLVAAVHREAKG